MDIVFIKEVNFFNIQSFRRGTIKGTKGLNVLRAQNQTGKSVLFKIITALGSKKEIKRHQWRDYISKRESQGLATVLFSDNSAAGILIKRTGDPVYLYYPDLSKDREKPLVSPDPFPEVIDKLGLLVDTDGKILNIINSKSINRFVDNSYTGPDIINKVVTNDRLTKLIEDNILSQTRMTNEKSAIKEEMRKAQLVMESLAYKDTSHVEDLIPLIEDAIKVAENLTLFDLFASRIDPTGITRDEVEDLLAYLDFIEYANSLKDIHPNLDIKADDINSYISLLEYVIAVMEIQCVEDTELINPFVLMLDYISSIFSISQEVRGEISELESLVLLLDNIGEFINNAKDMKSSLKSVEDYKKEISLLESEIRELGKEVECPIYGRIVHAEEICVPLNN